MKKNVLTTLFMLILNSGMAQTFYHGADDSSGDMDSWDSPDARTISHSIDHVMDSLWFKMEFYNSVDDQPFSMKIAIDSNNNIADGGTWSGTNPALKYDLLIDVYNNPAFPPALGNIYDAAAYISSNVNISFLDTHIVVIGLRLSEFYQSGVQLNYVAGVGSIIGSVNDDIPDSTYITISPFLNTPNFLTDQRVIVYPNPVSEKIRVHVPINGVQSEFFLMDLHGRIVLSGWLNEMESSINVESLNSGIYFLTLYNDEYRVTEKIIKQ